MFSSCVVIYREEGVFGFFAGLVPRIICDLGALWLANSLIFALNNFLIEDRDVKTYMAASVKVWHVKVSLSKVIAQ